MNVVALMISVFLLPLAVFAHGENTAGPHGGHIRMPGAFHTELLVNKDQSVKVYLLDVGFKNPVTKDSEVSVLFKSKKDSTEFKCTAVSDYFLCKPAKPYSTPGELIVKASREKALGAEAVYKLPLKKH